MNIKSIINKSNEMVSVTKRIRNCLRRRDHNAEYEFNDFLNQLFDIQLARLKALERIVSQEALEDSREEFYHLLDTLRK